jgi:hypothetical protein
MNKLFILIVLVYKFFSQECTYVKSSNKINLGHVLILIIFKGKCSN